MVLLYEPRLITYFCLIFSNRYKPPLYTVTCFNTVLRLKISQDEMIGGDFIPNDASREAYSEKVEKLIFKVPTC